MSENRSIARLCPRPARQALAALLCIGMLALAACGGKSAQTPVEQPSAGDGLAAFPPPSALRSASYDPAGLVADGSDFIAVPEVLHQNAAAIEDYAELNPDWTPTEPDFAGLAFACYAFDLAEYDRAGRISLSWQQQGDPADLWLGLSDFRRDGWAWHSVPANNILAVDFAGFSAPDSANMYVVVLTTGDDLWQLSRLQIGDLASLDGYVYAADGETPLAGVEVVIEGSLQFSRSTDDSGHWVVHGVPTGQYQASAHLIGWTFAPESRTVSVNSLRHELEPFVGTELPRFIFIGWVRDIEGPPLAGVSITITPHDSPLGGVQVQTDGEGLWRYDVPAGAYELEAAFAHYDFSPLRQNVTVDRDKVAPEFVGRIRRHTVEGYVFLEDGVTPLPDVTLKLQNAMDTETATTGVDGRYLFEGVYEDSWTISPSKFSYSFEPQSADLIVESDMSVDPFVGAVEPPHRVDGYVFEPDGETGVEGAFVRVRNTKLVGYSFETWTDADGYWVIEEVPALISYYVDLHKLGWAFEPESRSITVEQSDVRVDPFTGILLPTHNIGGLVIEQGTEAGIPGVTVDLKQSGLFGLDISTVTDENGEWYFDEVAEGYYTITPRLAPWRFAPWAWGITLEDDYYFPPFVGTKLEAWPADGYIYEADSSIPVPDVDVWFYSGVLEYRITTDDNGHYEILLPAGWWTVVPRSALWGFTPYSQMVYNHSAPLTVDPFYATPAE